MSMKTLIEQAKDYLNSRRGSWPKIAIETSLDIQWVYKFMSSRSMPDPGVTKIEKLLCHRDGTLNKFYPETTNAA